MWTHHLDHSFSVGTNYKPLLIRVKLQTADEHTYKAVMKVRTHIYTVML